MDRACRALGWAIAQVITLLAVEAVIVGGGVSLAGEAIFFEPLRRYVRTYVFPPLRDSYEILAPRLGEEVVVHGALAHGGRSLLEVCTSDTCSLVESSRLAMSDPLVQTLRPRQIIRRRDRRSKASI